MASEWKPTAAERKWAAILDRITVINALEYVCLKNKHDSKTRQRLDTLLQQLAADGISRHGYRIGRADETLDDSSTRKTG